MRDAGRARSGNPLAPFLGAVLIAALSPAAASATTIEVNSSGNSALNDGTCTLREAIEAANDNDVSGAAAGECPAGQAEPTEDLIEFGNAVTTVTVSGTALPAVTEQATIDGNAGTVAAAASPPAGSGLILSTGSDGSTIRDLTVNGFDSSAGVAGIAIVVSDNNTIEDTEVADPAAVANRNTIGISIASADGNVIRDSAIQNYDDEGVRISGSADNIVRGNTIGVGGPATEDHVGVEITGAGSDDNTIGGVADVRRNTISDNLGEGVVVENLDSANAIEGLVIRNNRIGTSEDGESIDANGGWGVLFTGAVTGATIRDNLISGNDENGIGMFASSMQPVGAAGPSATGIAENLLGTDDDGETWLPNGDDAIYVSGLAAHPAADNAIGGTAGLAVNGPCSGDCNLIVAGDELDGIELFGEVTGTQVLGNFVGTDLGGDDPLGTPERGLVIDGASNSDVGTAAAPNVIPGHEGSGVVLDDADVNELRANRIGVDAGFGMLGNGTDGVELNGSSDSNTIGGEGFGDGNLIRWNGDVGVDVNSGAGNAILGNALVGNGGLGIDLGTAGVTANDADDADGGANLLQNHPQPHALVIDGSGTLYGRLSSEPETEYRIEVFANAGGDASGYGEGQTFLDAFEVTTGADGEAVFAEPVPDPGAGQSVITATATELDSGGDPASTSEFGLNAERGCDVTGSSGDDPALTGTAGSDVICGLAGDDVIEAGTGNDVFIGGAGSDEVDYSASTVAIDADLTAGEITDDFALPGTDFVFEIENVTGTEFADVLDGDAADNFLDGGAGTDDLAGGDGDDTVKGGDGKKDDGRGGEGDDVVKGNDGKKDDLNGNDGKDKITGNGGSGDDCDGDAGNDRGGSGCEKEKSL